VRQVRDLALDFTGAMRSPAAQDNLRIQMINGRLP
jgi:hypothetical protein